MKVGRGPDAAQDAQVVDASWDRGDEGGGGRQLRSCAGVGGASWDVGHGIRLEKSSDRLSMFFFLDNLCSKTQM